MQNAIMRGMDAAHGAGLPTQLLGFGGILTTITNTLLYVVGAVSIVMIIVGGLRYVISGGNSAAVTTAKNTVLYAIVGLVIAVLAYALVNFVLNVFTPGVDGGSAGYTNV